MQKCISTVKRRPQGVWLMSLILACVALIAQAEDYTPEIGQPGKDVIWVPTPDELVVRMLDMAQVTQEDYVVDLGSGDGKIVIAAARDRNARATGIEYNPDMVALAERNAREAGVADRVDFIEGDFFEEDFSDATVVTMFLLPHLNLRLKDTILQMTPGTRVVSNAFDLGGWAPDESALVGTSIAHFWVVPARVEGTWLLEEPVNGIQSLTLHQHFQVAEGTAATGEAEIWLEDTSLSGAQLSFSLSGAGIARQQFSARVQGDLMEGQVTGPEGKATPFKAMLSGG